MATQTLAQRQTVINRRATPEMQRRHFELIAEIIAKELHGEYREKAAYAFAYTLLTTSVNFENQRFLKACKVNAFTESDNE
jgi:hypothetical protein